MRKNAPITLKFAPIQKWYQNFRLLTNKHGYFDRIIVLIFLYSQGFKDFSSDFSLVHSPGHTNKRHCGLFIFISASTVFCIYKIFPTLRFIIFNLCDLCLNKMNNETPVGRVAVYRCVFILKNIYWKKGYCSFLDSLWRC